MASDHPRQADFKRHYPFRLTPCSSRDYIDLIGPLLTGSGREGMRLLHSGCRYGENSYAIAAAFSVDIIATDEDTEGLLYARTIGRSLHGLGSVQFRYMTPFQYNIDPASCDIVLLDGILATQGKRKILREAHRMLAPDGRLVVYESYWLKSPPPPFVAAAWDSREHHTMTEDELCDLIAEAGFAVTSFTDSSKRLDSFYAQFSEQVRDIAAGGFEGMKHRKSLVKQYKHEIDVYRKNGGNAYMGYCGIVATAAPSDDSASEPDPSPDAAEETPPAA
jgi:SAM-dependent methyltransferase